MDDSLNKTPVISELRPLTYSMLINKSKNKESVFNLEQLVTNFSLDISITDNVVNIDKLPAFISKSYYQIQNFNKPDKLDFSYNYPPKGPIQSDFICPYCERKGPNYHKESCRRPFNSSLVLDHTTTRYPGAEPGTQYSLLVKKSGQKKIVSKRARSQTFTDNVEIFYENENEQQSVIRVSRNGTINIISASMYDTLLPELIVFRINKTSGAILSPPYTIESSHKYIISAQFNIIPEQYQADYLVQLSTLHSNLWNLPLFKKSIQGKTVFMVGTATNYYFVTKYNYNSGDQYSKNNKLTNPFIQFTLSKNDGIKIHVMIYIRGAVQLRASCTGEPVPLEYPVLEQVYRFLHQLLQEIMIQSYESGYNIIESELKPAKKSKIPNMRDGGQPKTCQNRAGTYTGSGDVRPIPYSFYGTCPMEGYYVPPRGSRRPDGKLEPCCKKLNKTGQDSEKRYNNIILNGYPDDEAILYGETVTPDDSAVFIPGTKIVEPRTFPGLNNMSKKQLIDFMEGAGYIRPSNVFDENPLPTNKSLVFSTLQPLKTAVPFKTIGFIVTPIHNDTIRVKLYIDEHGKSFFVNIFGDVTNSGLPDIPELKNTEIDGYLYPFKEGNRSFTFYPYDIVKLKGKRITTDYYKGQNKRYDFLHEAITSIQSGFIKMIFDLNIVGGSHYFLSQDTTGLLFIPVEGNDIFIWTDVLQDTNITIGVEAVHILGTNRWTITVQGKTLPENLIQQGKNNDIELPVSFTKGKGDTFIVLCKINLKKN